MCYSEEVVEKRKNIVQEKKRRGKVYFHIRNSVGMLKETHY
jgi:hypothetical protein